MRDHVVIAPDKFKGSLTAPEVAEHVAAGLGVPAVSLPVADGGDGTVDAVVACGFERVEVEVAGPTGERVVASYAVQGETAVVEMADASGLRRLSGGLAPLTATSYGTGELIAHAVRGGARRIVLGLGGSACTDGGAGLAQALGARFLDASGNELPLGGGALRDLAQIDISRFMTGLREISGHEPVAGHESGAGHDHEVGDDHGVGEGDGHRHASDAVAGLEFVVASDVDNPLLGPFGAAAVYGPQKGADPDEVKVLEAGLARLAAVAAHTHGLAGSVEHDGVVRSMGVAGQPGAGAAGGVGFAALAFLHAEIRPGIEYLLDLLDFDRHVRGARLVITGEGSLDEQSLRGKAPIGVANAAARYGVPVVAVCGRRAIGDEELRKAGIDAVYALTDLESDVRVCMTEAGPLLERLAVRIAATRLEDAGE
ncbi:glycerate kinase [Acrocarpospora corrugata]|uniref:Glycerate kinase n=1 Tax=Acrocarpospora corrugata TaxID=35763 RepID=A0A5M3VQ57_9ACTN|nr:glycerate kinase [Acrocarpospora corrugata]GER98914.1 glycerate kinase [Acrocarpospora corrugata]